MAASIQEMTDPYGKNFGRDEPADDNARRKPTIEEAEAILVLVRGGWLKLELNL